MKLGINNQALQRIANFLKLAESQISTEKYSQDLQTYVDFMVADGYTDEEEANERVQEGIQIVTKNMEVLKAAIDAAISRIPDWPGYSISIQPAHQLKQENYGRIFISLEPLYPDFAKVDLITNSKWPPGFTMFSETEVDDVLDAGDTDFFNNPDEEFAYFSLVNAIRSPEAIQTQKVMRLYTARPQSERDIYEGNSTVPSGIFLTNDYDHAEGLSRELSNEKEPRDIYKVKIENKYLIKTLEGRIEYYQAYDKSGNVPVMSIELLE